MTDRDTKTTPHPPSAPADDAAGVDRDNPWPGLASFTEDQAEFFHGRDREAAELLDLVRGATLAVLFGLSGLGKTSLLQAGLFPRLRRDDYLPVPIRVDYTPATPPPAEQVLRAVAAAATAAGIDAPPPEPGESLWAYFHRRDADFWSPRNRLVTPVLAIDQFEEAFTLGRSSAAARDRADALLATLAELVENRSPAAVRARLEADPDAAARYDFDRPRCRVLLSLREDFLPDLDALRPLLRGVLLNRLRIRPMTGTQAEAVVTASGGHLVEPGVSAGIVRFVAAARGAEADGPAGGVDTGAAASIAADDLSILNVEPALLSVVCRELNARRRSAGLPRITPILLAGSRTNILADFYERSVVDLPPAVRRFVEDRLLTRSGYRDSVALENALSAGPAPAGAADGVAGDFAMPADASGLTRDLLDRLVARRLVRVEDRLGSQRVELTHDVLADPVRASRDVRRQREVLAAVEAKAQAARRRRNRAVLVVGVATALLLVIARALWVKWEDVAQDARDIGRRAARQALLEELPRIPIPGEPGNTVSAFVSGQHPPFGQSLTDAKYDPTPLYFNHKKHLDIEAARTMPLPGRIGNCTACHREAGTSPARGDIAPISFAKDCAGCHELKLADGLTIPHTELEIATAAAAGMLNNMPSRARRTLDAMSDSLRASELSRFQLGGQPKFGRRPWTQPATTTTKLLTPDELAVKWVNSKLLPIAWGITQWYNEANESQPGAAEYTKANELPGELPNFTSEMVQTEALWKDERVVGYYLARAIVGACVNCHGLSDTPDDQPGSLRRLVLTAGPPMSDNVVRQLVQQMQASSAGAMRQSKWPLHTLPTGIEGKPRRWYRAAAFSHDAHKSESCNSCHDAANSSEKTSDILLPTINRCFECHVQSSSRGSGAPAACSTCHNTTGPLPSQPSGN